MPNIRAMIHGDLGDKATGPAAVDRVGLYLMASNGKEVVITQRMLQQFFADSSGNAAAKGAAAILATRQAIATALGEDMIDVSKVTIAKRGSGAALDFSSIIAGEV